ncbi:MAG: hypothetical protein L7V30_01755, partial [Gammaproteobacteria bacterium]|nr:hypothetical protein [Gammaproteobacteria bacterium]
KYKKLYKKDYQEIMIRIKNEVPSKVISSLDKCMLKNHKPMATRKSSQVVMTSFGEKMPALLGGSADLKGSNHSYYDDMSIFSPNNHAGK